VDVQPNLPAPPPFARLQQSARIALFLDFDGTLVEIADDPQAIGPPVGLAARLVDLASRLGGACAVVSGRSIEDLRQFIGPVAIAFAGSHGGHVVAASGTSLREAEGLPQGVGEALRSFSDANGLLHEVKAHGAALHYRARPEFGQEAVNYARVLATEHGLATKTGKCVIELVRPGIDKGGAVELLMREPAFADSLPIFVGDDLTDEDGFAACERLGGFGLIVGDRPATAARYRVGTVKDVYAWLSL
jgi:trehalose 6-phosphate phosphatase